MSFGRKRIIFGFSALAAAGVAALPMTTGFAFETGETAIAESDDDLLFESGISPTEANAAGQAGEPTIALDDTAASDDLTAAEAAAQAEAIIADAEEANEDFVEPVVAVNDARDEEFNCLTKVILHESRGEPYNGQMAVAQTVMNRVASSQFPNTICGVIYQRSQFSNIRSFSPRRSGRAWNQAVEIAIDARNGVSEQVAPGALYFHATRVRPAFARRKERVAQLGNHIFYR